MVISNKGGGLKGGSVLSLLINTTYNLHILQLVCQKDKNSSLIYKECFSSALLHCFQHLSEMLLLPRLRGADRFSRLVFMKTCQQLPEVCCFMNKNRIFTSAAMNSSGTQFEQRWICLLCCCRGFKMLACFLLLARYLS